MCEQNASELPAIKIWCDREKHRKQMNHDFDPQVSKIKGNSMIPLLVSSNICKKQVKLLNLNAGTMRKVRVHTHLIQKSGLYEIDP